MAEPKRSLRRAGVLTVAVLLGLGLLAGRTVFSRISNAKTLEAQVAERNKSYVRVTQPTALEPRRCISRSRASGAACAV